MEETHEPEQTSEVPEEQKQEEEVEATKTVSQLKTEKRRQRKNKRADEDEPALKDEEKEDLFTFDEQHTSEPVEQQRSEQKEGSLLEMNDQAKGNDLASRQNLLDEIFAGQENSGGKQVDLTGELMNLGAPVGVKEEIIQEQTEIVFEITEIDVTQFGQTWQQLTIQG